MNINLSHAKNQLSEPRKNTVVESTIVLQITDSSLYDYLL